MSTYTNIRNAAIDFTAVLAVSMEMIAFMTGVQ